MDATHDQDRVFVKHDNKELVHFTSTEAGIRRIKVDRFLRGYANESLKFDGVLATIAGQQV